MHKDKGCGKVNLDNVDQVINLAGWVDSWRDHGSLLFLDLRDSTGTIQIVFDKSVNSDNHKLASSIRNEWVIQVEGIVKKRIEGRLVCVLIEQRHTAHMATRNNSHAEITNGSITGNKTINVQ